MLSDKHWTFLNLVKYAAKGALVGGLMGSYIYFLGNKFQPAVIKKILNYTKLNKFGNIKYLLFHFRNK